MDVVEPRNRRGTVVALAAAVGISAAASGLFAAVYEARQGDIGRLRGQIAATERSIASTQQQNAQVASSLEGLNAQWSQLQATNKQLHKCADPAKDMVIAVHKNDDAAGTAAAEQLYTECGR